MKRSLALTILLSAIILGTGCGRVKMASPGETLKATLLRDDTSAMIKVEWGGRHLSTMRVGIAGDSVSELFRSGFKLDKSHSSGSPAYNEYLMRAASGMDLRVRVFDNALAFRYESEGDFPGKVLGESSRWEVPAGTNVWYFERDKNYSYKLKSYAGEWRSSEISALPSATRNYPLQGLPLIFEWKGGGYGFLTEVGLINYSGMRLRVLHSGALKADFTEGEEGFEVDSALVSPWKVICFEPDLTALVNQNIVKALSPAPDPELYADLSYISPGKSAWSWFSKFTGTPEQERAEIDRAARLGFKYSTIDEGWALWPDSWNAVRSLCAYAADSGIGLILWKHSREINDPAGDYSSMRLWLDSVKRSGAAGIKTDFMDSESKKTIDFDIKLLREAAKRKLLVNLHGCQKPSGEQYTFPNEITREGIRGIELNNLGEGTITAGHNAALPFTRFVVGHGDYTPLSFSNPGTTTWAHQLATLVCFTSGVQTIAEDTEQILSDPKLSAAAGFIAEVPTTWDETIVLPGSSIGDMAIIARRNDVKWYVGVLNGTDKPREVKIDLGFLMYGQHVVQIIVDDMSTEKVMLTPPGHRTPEIPKVPVVPFKQVRMIVERTQTLTLEVAPEGGAVIVIE